MKYVKILLMTVGILEIVWLAVLLWPQKQDIVTGSVADKRPENRYPEYVPPPLTHSTTSENEVGQWTQLTQELDDVTVRNELPIVEENDVELTYSDSGEFPITSTPWDDAPRLTVDNLMKAFGIGDVDLMLSYFRGSAKGELQTSIMSLWEKGISDADVARGFAAIKGNLSIAETEFINSDYAKVEIKLSEKNFASFELEKYDDGWYIVKVNNWRAF